MPLILLSVMIAKGFAQQYFSMHSIGWTRCQEADNNINRAADHEEDPSLKHERDTPSLRHYLESECGKVDDENDGTQCESDK